ncbi:hypothetical protein [Streptomyces sp. NRRL S-350]|uniref:hypothetical protein n=1 Tax=Streptomyces sp. NRRL S-350 TaxID=1463902 RepID=UPI0004C1AD1E|nr:hypothetical protein [Streptomyces sp. NRRL S-350]
MVLGRRNRREADAGRAKFIANEEKVRSWPGRWDCPEVAWPDFEEALGPGPGRPRERDRWLDLHAPFLERYDWLLEAVPRANGVHELGALWEFGAGHGFDRLTIRFRSVLDPEYLAEKLALGIEAADLKGWQDGDTQSAYEWLCEGVGGLVGSGMVRGKHRVGFVLLELTCAAVGGTDVITELRVSLTTTSLEGRPLKPDGRD